MIRIAVTFWAILGALGAVGCNSRVAINNPPAVKPASKPNERRVKDYSSTKSAVRTHDTTSARSQRARHDTGESWLPPLRAPGSQAAGEVAPESWARGIAFTEPQALDRIERELKDALSVRPTLVVWLFDQSAAVGATRRTVAAAAVQMHSRLSQPPAVNAAAANGRTTANKLLTAMIAFGDQVRVLTPEPVNDPSKLPAPDTIAELPAAGTQAYVAVLTAAKRFAEFRTRGHEVVFVLVAHSASADESAFKSAVEILSRAAIPVFGIGPAAPFGRLVDALNSANGSVESVGYESAYPERIQLFLPDNQGDAELADSGYGPFHLERLCRATDGQFLRIRPGGSGGWKTGDDGEAPRDLLRKYAPDYVSDEDYKKILAENRACQALHEAARLPPARVLIAPTYDFRKEDEAAMARAISMAQRAPAENQAALEKLHQTLATGEADRPRVMRPRWQVAFDLAYGRACAARARNEGYNHMLAVLKNGKTFTNPDSTTWSLKPAEGIAGRSDLDKMAKTAKTSLTRVVNEHAGTPWAALAKRELATPCGWEWTER